MPRSSRKKGGKEAVAAGGSYHGTGSDDDPSDLGISGRAAPSGVSESVMAVLKNKVRPKRDPKVPEKFDPCQDKRVLSASTAVQEFNRVDHTFTGIIDTFKGVNGYPAVKLNKATLQDLFNKIHDLFGSATGSRRGIGYADDGFSGSISGNDVAKIAMEMMRILSEYLGVPASPEIFKDFVVWDLGSGDGRLLLMLCFLMFKCGRGVELPVNRVNVLRILSAVLVQQTFPQFSYSTLEFSFGDLGTGRPLEDYFQVSSNGGKNKVVVSFCESMDWGDKLAMLKAIAELGPRGPVLVVLADKYYSLRDLEKAFKGYDCKLIMEVKMVGGEQTSVGFFVPRDDAVDLTVSPEDSPAKSAAPPSSPATCRNYAAWQPSCEDSRVDGAAARESDADVSATAFDEEPENDSFAYSSGSDDFGPCKPESSPERFDNPSDECPGKEPEDDSSVSFSGSDDFGACKPEYSPEKSDNPSDECPGSGSDEEGGSNEMSDEKIETSGVETSGFETSGVETSGVETSGVGASGVETSDYISSSSDDEESFDVDNFAGYLAEIKDVLRILIPGICFERVGVKDKTLTIDVHASLTKRGKTDRFTIIASYSYKDTEEEFGRYTHLRMAAMVLNKFENVRSSGNPFQKLKHPFNGGTQSFASVCLRKDPKVGMIKLHLLAVEALDEFMPGLMKEVHDEFLKNGRITSKLRDMIRGTLNSLCVTHSKGVTHGGLCLEAMKHRDSKTGKEIVFGSWKYCKSNEYVYQKQGSDRADSVLFASESYSKFKKTQNPVILSVAYPDISERPLGDILPWVDGVPLGYKQPNAKRGIHSDTCQVPKISESEEKKIVFENGVKQDLYALALLILEPFINNVKEDLPEDVCEAMVCRMAKRREIQKKLRDLYKEEKRFHLLDLLRLIEDYFETCSPSEERSRVIEIAARIVGHGSKAFTYREECIKEEIRAESLVGLLKLVCDLLNYEMDPETPARDALCSPFCMRYLADDEDLEEELTRKGVIVEEPACVKALKRKKKWKGEFIPTVVFNLPGFGLILLYLSNVKKGDYFFYGGFGSARVQRDHAPGEDSTSFHTIPLPDGYQIDGTPRSPDNKERLCLRELIATGSIGSLAASSRKSPGESAKGNMKLDENKKVYTVSINSKECSFILMFATEDVEHGNVPLWDYNWATGCDYVLSIDRIEKGMTAYSIDPARIDFIMRQIELHRATLLKR